MNNELQVKPEIQAIMEVQQKKDMLINAFTNPDIVQELFVFSPDYIHDWSDEKKETFVRGTIIKIANDDKLKKCFESAQGKMSIFEAMKKACSTGLEIGGKHAYLVPQNENVGDSNNKKWVTKARFSIKASGYVALLCGGDKPVFDFIRWDMVRADDDCEIDTGTGEVSHKKKISKDPGEVIGGWVQAKWRGRNQKEARFFSVEKMNRWKESSQANYNNSPWNIWFEEMGEQAMIRHFCDKYEQARDLLSAAIYDQESEYETDTLDECEDALNGALADEPGNFDFPEDKNDIEETEPKSPEKELF